LVAGLLKGDYGLISRSLRDVIVEPIRSVLIPGFDDAKRAAVDAGALGSGISGSGPSIFALSSTRETAAKAGDAMQKVFDKIGLENEVFVSVINDQGPRILEER
jgi:homoserine kinase